MQKETNLRAIKDVALTFLALEPEPTELAPLVIKHPFTDCGVVWLQSESGADNATANILEDKSALQKWREMFKKEINSVESLLHISLHLTNSYKLAFLKYAMPYMSQKDFTEYLFDAWVCTEAPNGDPNFTVRQMADLFRKADPKILMDDNERQQLYELDDTVAVYRGVTEHNAKRIKVLSWTLNRDTAEWFAHRFGEDGTVYEAEIPKEHILALFASRNESEVIVDPKFLMNITEAPSQCEDIGLGLNL